MSLEKRFEEWLQGDTSADSEYLVEGEKYADADAATAAAAGATYGAKLGENISPEVLNEYLAFPYIAREDVGGVIGFHRAVRNSLLPPISGSEFVFPEKIEVTNLPYIAGNKPEKVETYIEVAFEKDREKTVFLYLPNGFIDRLDNGKSRIAKKTDARDVDRDRCFEALIEVSHLKLEHAWEGEMQFTGVLEEAGFYPDGEVVSPFRFGPLEKVMNPYSPPKVAVKGVPERQEVRITFRYDMSMYNFSEYGGPYEYLVARQAEVRAERAEKVKARLKAKQAEFVKANERRTRVTEEQRRIREEFDSLSQDEQDEVIVSRLYAAVRAAPFSGSSDDAFQHELDEVAQFAKEWLKERSEDEVASLVRSWRARRIQSYGVRTLRAQIIRNVASLLELKAQQDDLAATEQQ